MVERNKTYVARLRVRSAAPETLSVKLRLNQALSSLNLHPASLPPSAIAFIRKLSDPAPGSIKLNDAASIPVAWERAVVASVDQIVRRATRPALEHVGAGADAVLFIDRAEMLACLAMDWCDGTAITRWWWQSLFRATDVSSAVIQEWLASIEYAPAAFAKLAEKKMAVSFASALPARIASKLFESIILQFGLSQLRNAASYRSRSETETEPSNAYASPEGKQPEETRKLSSDEVLQLSRRLVPEIFSPRLELDSRQLLAVALMLDRAPGLLRARGFLSRLLASVASSNQIEIAAALKPDEQKKPGSDAPTALMRFDSPSRLPLRSRPSKKEDNSPDFELDEIVNQQRLQYRGDDRASSAERIESRTIGDIGRPTPDFNLERYLELDRRNSSSLATPSPIEHPHSIEPEALANTEVEVTAATIELAAETRLGGLFYLINVALALDLYGDFTRPLEPGIDLSIWDFLAMTGRELIGDAIEVDAIWHVLARLAGRAENEPPGSRFDPGDEWRLPAEWLNAFPETDQWSYQTIRGRLIVWQPAGFEALNLKLGSGVSMRKITAKIESETRIYSNITGFKRQTRTKVHKRESSRDRWIRCIADYLRVRLARSLGIEPGAELIRMLFERAARVEVSPARLNVFFSLADLPIEIRLAGLDRDPGWVPSAGRAIALHFD